MKAIPLLFLTGLILLAATCAVLAAGDGFEPPEIKKGSYWAAIAVAIVAVAGICVVAFKSSKKTHLD